MTDLEVANMLAAYHKEIEATEGIEHKGLVQLKHARLIRQKLASDGDLASVTNSCSHWIPDKRTSATSCANCGKDRWAHDL